MSNLKEVYLLSDYKIDEKNSAMANLITKFNYFKQQNKLYFAVYYLDSLILKDGTSQEYNGIFLDFIIDNFEKLLNEIEILKFKDTSQDIISFDELKPLNDIIKYDFYYFRDCFDKYEISLSQTQLKNLFQKKLKYNNGIIQKFPILINEYSKLVNDISMLNQNISADYIYTTINNINKKLEKLDSKRKSKLLNLYIYLDCDLILNNNIFDCLINDKFYLNKFSFGLFDNLGIPIGYSNNQNLILRYLFSNMKKKIIEVDSDLKKVKNNNKKPKNESIEFVFKIFKEIFSKVKENKLELIKYFIFIFDHIIFKGSNNITKIYNLKLKLNGSTFERLCDQFLEKTEIDKERLAIYEKYEKKIEFKNNKAKLYFDDEEIILDLKNYSINTFIYHLSLDSEEFNESVSKNYSRKLFCKDKIYGEYSDDYIELLKKICRSNIAKIMQSSHEEFNVFESLFSKDLILDDLFNNRLHFYPYECKETQCFTDKCLMEIYLSSTFLNGLSKVPDNLYENVEEFLYLFNMSYNSIIFQHEALNHYISAYFYYYNSENKRIISVNTNKTHIYYPIQKLDKIKIKPKYLDKFLKKLNENELNELTQVSYLSYEEFLEKHSQNEKDLKKAILENEDDEGYFYERQLFTDLGEKKLKSIDFLQALMLIDEDAYNLDPVHFHYCFLELKNVDNYNIIKSNFRSRLLSKILKNIDTEFEEEIKALTIIAKRSGDEGLYFEYERPADSDVSPSFLNELK